MLLSTAKLAMTIQALVILGEGLWVTVSLDLTGIIWNRNNTDTNGTNKIDGKS